MFWPPHKEVGATNVLKIRLNNRLLVELQNWKDFLLNSKNQLQTGSQDRWIIRILFTEVSLCSPLLFLINSLLNCLRKVLLIQGLVIYRIICKCMMEYINFLKLYYWSEGIRGANWTRPTNFIYCKIYILIKFNNANLNPILGPKKPSHISLHIHFSFKIGSRITFTKWRQAQVWQNWSSPDPAWAL